MSIPVALADLVAQTEEFGWAYLLTVRDDQRPHVVAVSPVWADEALTMNVGTRTAENIRARSSISLCYPPVEPGGYSLIVDGEAEAAASGDVQFVPSGAVLHRPAQADFEGSQDGCASDCLPVSPAES
jgi:hypothetical protein